MHHLIENAIVCLIVAWSWFITWANLYGVDRRNRRHHDR